MDICRWLQETPEPNIQTLSPARGLEYEIQHQPVVAHGNRRDRFSAGSPLKIAFPERHAHHNHQKHARTPSSKCDTSPAYSSSSGSASDSTTSSSGQRAYRKRPRHRTKADKYESKVNTKEHGQRRKRDGKREHLGRSKRKSRKKNNDAHATGIVHSFHARNVLKERLTVSYANSVLTLRKVLRLKLTVLLAGSKELRSLHPRARFWSCKRSRMYVVETFLLAELLTNHGVLQYPISYSLR